MTARPNRRNHLSKVAYVLLSVLFAVCIVKLLPGFLRNVGWIMINHADSVQHYQQSSLWMRTALELRSTDDSALRGLGWALASTGAERSAREAWSHIPHPDQFLMEFALRALASQEYEEALLWLERTHTITPQKGDAWYFAGTIHETLRDQAAALEAYQIAAKSSDLRSIGVADVYSRLARVWQANGDSAAAYEAYKLAEEIDDFHVPYNRVLMLVGLGQSALERQEYNSAITYFNRAIAEEPSYGWAYFRLGIAKGLCCEEWAEAVAIINAGIVQDRDNPWGYLFLGDAHAARGATEEALAAYHDALELHPEWPMVETRLATLEREE